MEIEPQLVTIKQVTVPPLASIPTLKTIKLVPELLPKSELLPKLGPKPTDTNLTCMDYFWYSFKTKRD